MELLMLALVRIAAFLTTEAHILLLELVEPMRLAHHRQPPALHRPGDRQTRGRRRQHGAGCAGIRLHERPHAARAPGVPGGHPRQLRPDTPGAGRDHRPGCRGNDALWRQAQGRAAVSLQLRHQQPPQRRQNAPDARTAAPASPLAGSGR